MIPPDALIASLCASIYSPTAIIGQWDHFDPGLDDGVLWAIRKLPGYDVIVFRGSITPLDWIRDFRALTRPTKIGHVHIGFYAGMETVWAQAKPMINQPVIVTGHSLGAARACILTGLMVADGMAPVRRVTFGEPKPGLLDFAAGIKDVPAACYRNGDDMHHDLVTDLPLSFPPFQYVHPTPVIPVFCKPDGSLFEQLGAFAYHHVELYQTALSVLAAKDKAV